MFRDGSPKVRQVDICLSRVTVVIGTAVISVTNRFGGHLALCQAVE